MRKSTEENPLIDSLKQCLEQIAQNIGEIKTICQQMKEETVTISNAVSSLADTVSHLTPDKSYEPAASYQSKNTSFPSGSEGPAPEKEFIPFGCAKVKEVGDDIVLKVVSEQDEQYAVYYIRNGGQESEVVFNPKSVKYALMYADAQLFPFFEVEYGNGVATNVEATGSGSAKWENGQWVLKKKAKIKIV